MNSNAITDALAAENGLISSVLAAARVFDDVANGGTLEHALARLQASAAGAQARIASALARFTAIVGDVAEDLDQAATGIFEDLGGDVHLERAGIDPPTPEPIGQSEPERQVEPSVAEGTVAELPAAVEPVIIDGALTASPIPNVLVGFQGVQADEATREPAQEAIATPTAAQALDGLVSVHAAACSPVESAKDDRKPAPSAPRPKPTLPAPKPSTTKKGRRRPRPST